MKKILSLLLALMMLLASVCMLASCNDTEDESSKVTQKSITLSVIHQDGTTKEITITTSEKYLGKALLDEGIIQGEDGPYGIYIKTVDGETLDYDTHGKYWAFYINDEYAPTGADKTEIVNGAKYTFKAE